LAIEVGMAIPSARLIRVLSRLIDCYGPPDAIRLANGREMISDAFTEWGAAMGLSIRYIQPGKPNQNAFIERFNRPYRTEVLDAHLFANLVQSKQSLNVGSSITTNTARMSRWAASRRRTSCLG
jgi:putative transposase